MEAARNAVNKITGRTGHKTDVDEYVNPAVTSQTVKPHRHEETTQAIDREVHQDHYHTTVQPVSHTETLPEKHTHNLMPQVHKEVRHDNEHETQRRVQAELGQFKNTSTTAQTTHSAVAAPTVTGEHVHHHVHETVQPIIHKQTVQPEVVHTTVPVHETHHAAAQHHGISALPMKTLNEFSQVGGVIGGSKSHTQEQYDGAPRPYNDKLSTTIEKVLPGHHNQSGVSQTTGHNTQTLGHGTQTAGHNTQTLGHDTQTAGHNTQTLGHGTQTAGHGTQSSGISGTQSSGLTGSQRPDSGYADVRDHTGKDVSSRDHDTSTGTGKPSLMDKLNPKVDSNGDGKAGFMK